jgi:tRNA pseudouridine55 synthase
MTPGIHLFHKPVGPTSFSIVQSCHEAAKEAVRNRPGKKPLSLCHAGALDPFASGLIMILVEPATKLFDYLHAIPKTYEATIRWGVETDNCDPLGKPVFTGDASGLTPELLDQTIAGHVGWQEQTPPATSNKRVDGERAYLKAHRGEEVVLPPSRVYLHEAQWLAHDLANSQSTIRLVTRGGYYVRSLARDLGRQLNVGAHLAALRRTHIGPWSDPGPESAPIHVSTQDTLPWCSTRLLSDQDLGDLRQKQSIGMGQLIPPTWELPENFQDDATPVRGIHQDKLVFLMWHDEEGRLSPLANLRPGL